MKFNKKYFLAIFTALGIQITFGVSTSYATECYKKFRKMCVENNGKHSDMQFNCNDSELQLSNKLFDHYDEKKGEWTLTDLDNYISDEQRRIKIAKSNGRNYSQEEFSTCRYQEQKKYYQTGLRPSSNTSSNQTIRSGSSNQSASAETSNSPVSQNKQSYQAAQFAHNQANAGKDKKRNAQAEVPECIKSNANQTNFKNGCNYAVNISYCFSGEN